MWLFTTQGFYSVVADRDDPHRVLVRARARGDIEALRDQTPDLESIESAGSDYRWRAFVSREDWTKAVAELATAIDYDNFKNAVGDRRAASGATLPRSLVGDARAAGRRGSADRLIL